MFSKVLLRCCRFTLLTSAFLMLFSSICSAANFTANMTTKNSGMSVTGKLFVKGTNIRQEMVLGGKKQVVICRGDKNVTWMVDPSQKCYGEVAGAKSERSMRKMLKEMADEKYLGKETVNGYSCKKYRYILRADKTGTILQWRSDKLDWPIKTEVKREGQALVVEYKNIKEVKPADSLFEVPKGYKKKAINAPAKMKMPPAPAKKK